MLVDTSTLPLGTLPRRRRASVVGVWAAVGALLLLYVAMAMTAAENKAPAFDEIGHLTSGYSVWLHHDFRLDPANGDLVKRWAALPLLLSRPSFPPTSDPMWQQGEQHLVGFEFFFGRGNDPASLLRQGRGMVAM